MATAPPVPFTCPPATAIVIYGQACIASPLPYSFNSPEFFKLYKAAFHHKR